MSFESICVVGMGYIGLPTASVFASCKRKVVGLDVNQSVINTINSGKIHIVEPDLEDLVKAVVGEGYLQASLEVKPADAFLIAVPTPFKSDHQPDLSYIESAARNIAPVLKKGDLIILESTSPVGTTDKIAEWLADARPDLAFPHQDAENEDVFIAYCPERVLPGYVLKELFDNDRVIGGMSQKSSLLAKSLYEIFLRGECVITDNRTAEMVKLTENAYRDVNISFANELSLVCDEKNINVWELIKLANRHPRVNVLSPGPGVGGHCIAVDPWFIVSGSPDSAKLIRQARMTNDYKPKWVINKIEDVIGDLEKKLEKPTSVAFYGISFKPDIDDLRESPSLEIALNFSLRQNQEVLIVEPNIKKLPDAFSNARLVSKEEAAASAELHVLLVSHSSFKDLSFPEGDAIRILDFCGITHLE